MKRYDFGKHDRRYGKFNFKLRDWQFELDDAEDVPRVPMKNGRPRNSEVIWRRSDGRTYDRSYDEQDVG